MLYALYHNGQFVRTQFFDSAPPVLASAKQMEWLPYTPPAPPAPTPEQIMQGIVWQTQQRLDAFARTRNYDGILSACTYATSPTLKFSGEGQYCVNSRDATWATLYTILAEVEAGTRPMPTSYTDIEPDLPVLVWPS